MYTVKPELTVYHKYETNDASPDTAVKIKPSVGDPSAVLFLTDVHEGMMKEREKEK